jgi:hypothetical protein
MAANIKVSKFDGENVDAEAWLQEFTRAAVVNNWADNVKVNWAAAHLKGPAAEWYERDKVLPDANGGHINAWNDRTDQDTIARSFVTKFKAEFISEERREETELVLSVGKNATIIRRRHGYIY